MKKTKKLPPWSKRQAKAKRKLDRLFSEFILLRDKRTCRFCGKSIDETGKQFHIDNSHIIPRQVTILRWNTKNTVALDFGCHKAKRFHSWHSNPLWAAKWIRSLLGDAHCDELLRLAELPYEFNEAEAIRIEAELKAAIADLQANRSESPATPENPVQS